MVPFNNILICYFKWEVLIFMDVSSARNLISNKNSNTQSIPAVRDTKYWRSRIKVKSDKDIVQSKEITDQETKPKHTLSLIHI